MVRGVRQGAPVSASHRASQPGSGDMRWCACAVRHTQVRGGGARCGGLDGGKGDTVGRIRGACQHRANPCTSAPGSGSPLPTFASGLGSPLPHLHRDLSLQIAARSALRLPSLLAATSATSAPGLGAPRPHLQWAWAHASQLHRHWAHPLPHLQRDWAHPGNKFARTGHICTETMLPHALLQFAH